jgi:hypothetical protein
VNGSDSGRLSAGGGTSRIALDRDHELGDVAVADDPSELPFGLERTTAEHLPRAERRARIGDRP